MYSMYTSVGYSCLYLYLQLFLNISVFISNYLPGYLRLYMYDYACTFMHVGLYMYGFQRVVTSFHLRFLPSFTRYETPSHSRTSYRRLKRKSFCNIEFRDVKVPLSNFKGRTTGSESEAITSTREKHCGQ